MSESYILQSHGYIAYDNVILSTFYNLQFIFVTWLKLSGSIQSHAQMNYIIIIHTITDFATRAQCFAVYVVAILQKQPHRAANLMGYLVNMVSNAKKLKWSMWLVYDQNFRQLMAYRQDLVWSKTDPVIYAYASWIWGHLHLIEQPIVQSYVPSAGLWLNASASYITWSWVSSQQLGASETEFVCPHCTDTNISTPSNHPAMIEHSSITHDSSCAFKPSLYWFFVEWHQWRRS